MNPDQNRPLKICHVVIGLGVGGAEMMLLKLLQGMDRKRFEPTVVALMDGGELAERIAALGVPVHFLGMRSVLDLPSVLVKLWRLARSLETDTVQGWMYHGNVAASLLARWSPLKPDLIWNIRHTLSDLDHEKFLTRALIRLGGRWSRQPRQVVHNSSVSIGQHARFGFEPGNACMIPNGFDTTVFRPDESARSSLREKLGLGPEVTLVGTLGRRHPMKGQEDFLRAVAQVAARHPAVHFVMGGRGVTADDETLAELAQATGAVERVHLTGPQAKPASYLAGLDVFCLASTHGEGFPNVLGEAMSCAVPCVATDVGEAAVIVDRWGRVVPVSSAAKLAGALEELLALEPAARRALGQEARSSIVTRYDLPNIAQRYESLYDANGAESQ